MDSWQEAIVRERKWLAGLKVGDTVMVQNSAYQDGYLESKVDRATKTLLIVGRYRFKRADGWEQGKRFSYDRIVEKTLELLAEIAEAKWRRENERGQES